MNSTAHTAYVLDQHRAADLVHTGEILRRQAERPVTVTDRPSRFAVVTEWLSAILRRPQVPLAAR